MRRWGWLASFFVAAILVFLLGTPAAFAQLKGKPPNATALEGLLAKDVVIQDASAAFNPAALAGQKLAVIPSANFNEYARRWISFYEQGGQESNWAYKMLGFSRDTMRGQEHSADPRQFADRLALLLEPYVGSVSAAPDFVAARDQGASYYLVVDAWLGASSFGSKFVGWAGVVLLDGDLRQVFAVSKMQEAKRGGGLFENVVEADARAMREAIGGASGQVLDALQARLGPAPVAGKAP